MTDLTVVPPISVRPVPWPRLAWVVWRRYRATLLATVGVLALIAAYVVIDGVQMRTAYDNYRQCTPNHSAKCQFAWMTFRDGYGVSGLLVIVLTILPGIIGAFVGAPVLARELETGTFRYTWTQGAGRMRWAVATLVAGALGVMVLMGTFGALVAWHNQPLAETGIVPRLRATVFAVTGPAAAGWALLAFAIGALAGLVVRRVLPALAAAFAVWFGIALLVATSVRPNYLAPLTTTDLQLADRDLSLAQWWTKGGVRVSDAEITSLLQSIGLQDAGTGAVTAGPGSGSDIDPTTYLLAHGFTQVTSYQPDGRFWAFQWIEFGWLAIVSAALIAGALWLLRRRAS